MATVTVSSDFGAQENKICHYYSSLSACHDMMGPDALILVFLNVGFQDSFFTLLFHPHEESLVPPYFLPLE